MWSVARDSENIACEAKLLYFKVWFWCINIGWDFFDIVTTVLEGYNTIQFSTKMKDKTGYIYAQTSANMKL